MLSAVVPEGVCGAISAATLVALGIFNLLRNYLEKLVKRKNSGGPAMLYFDGTAADTDHSKSISPKEAIALSVALSADSLVTGISAGLGKMNLPILCAGAFVAGIIAVSLGWRLGRKIVSSFNLDLGWLCGAMLIILAFVK